MAKALPNGKSRFDDEDDDFPAEAIQKRKRKSPLGTDLDTEEADLFWRQVVITAVRGYTSTMYTGEDGRRQACGAEVAADRACRVADQVLLEYKERRPAAETKS